MHADHHGRNADRTFTGRENSLLPIKLETPPMASRVCFALFGFGNNVKRVAHATNCEGIRD
jgi:hypothetical protein